MKLYHCGVNKKLTTIKCCFYKPRVGGFSYVNGMKMTFEVDGGASESIESANFAIHERLPNI